MAVGVVVEYQAAQWLEKIGKKRVIRTGNMQVAPGNGNQGAIFLNFPRRTLYKLMSYVHWNYFGGTNNQSVWIFNNDDKAELKAARIACSGWNLLAKKVWDKNIANNVIDSYDLSTAGIYLDDQSIMFTNNSAAVGAGLFTCDANCVQIREGALDESTI